MDAHNMTIFEPVQELSPVDDLKHKYNVCFYCRISTSKDSQKWSIDNQKSFMEYELSQHPNWNIDMEKDVYFDEAASGTTEEKRDAFNMMIKLAKAGKYDLIVAKDVSRVFRNSRKFIELIDDLKKQKIYIWF
jgi:DNA invertase Pin-like site-specific DNA recombinase